MGKTRYGCSWCGGDAYRWPSAVGKNVYCTKACRSKHLSKKHNPGGYLKHPHLGELNKKLNPKRMTFETRTKLREAKLGLGEGKTYEKTFGRHTHRVVAELKIGRKLKCGEVVHHIDGDRRNNDPDNLMVFASQSEHLEWHKIHDVRFGGDAK